MKPAYIVSTPKGQYICEVFEHPSAGYVWTANGKRINYAIPFSMKTAKDRLTYQVQRSFNDYTLQLTACA
jgi:hypothetical protein